VLPQIPVNKYNFCIIILLFLMKVRSNVQVFYFGLFHLYVSRKDVYNIFQFPVSDAVAPGYSKVIKQPMDFLTMSLKIERNEYINIEQLKVRNF